MKRIKWCILLTLLCGTLFISEIGCDTVSFSSGFAYPYLVIDTEGCVALPGNIPVSVAANLVFVIACVTLILKLNLEARKQFQKKIFFSLLFNIVIFNIYALTQIHDYNLDIKFVDTITAIFEYYTLVPPFSLAISMNEPFFLEFWLFNILSRVYFLVATGFIFLLITLLEKLRRRVVSIHRTAKKGLPADS